MYNKPSSQKGHRQAKCQLRTNLYNMRTFLHIKDVPPDNNDVERTNRVFVSIKNDGGDDGNRTSRGMEANSILFTLLATGKIRGESFFLICCANHITLAKTTESFVYPSAYYNQLCVIVAN